MQLFILFIKLIQPMKQSFQWLILTQSQSNSCLSYSLLARHSLAIVLIQLLAYDRGPAPYDREPDYDVRDQAYGFDPVEPVEASEPDSDT